jgi:Family of unknown function (DUF6077)/Family of unknown function (DUF6541)
VQDAPANKGSIQLRWFEAGVVLTVVAACAVLWPFRDALATMPGVTLLATLALFLTPGVLLGRWFLGAYFSGPALAPAAVVSSVGLFALLALPMLILQATLAAYLWACGSVVAVCWIAAAVLTFRKERVDGGRAGLELSDRGGLLWGPFAGLVAALAYIARITAPSYYGDIWIYLSWVREYLSGDRLASVEPFFGGDVGLSRARINGWLLEQAAVARVSGVDPVDLAFSYLNPALVVVAFLVFYALARTLFKSEKAALLSGCLYSLFFLVHLSQSRISWGGEFVQRLPEDKFVAKFLFFPLALAFAYAFLEGGAKRYFLGFALLCSAVMAVHPIGLAIIGISMAGFAVMHLAANPRSRAAWIRISAMGIAGVPIVAVPAALVSAFTDEPLSNALADSDINSGDPDVLRNMIFVSPERNRILELADGSYIMHPSLLLDPMIATAFLIGLPFLLWRLKRSLAAQLLFGVMYLTTVVVYVPPITTFLGDKVVLPGQIWRLAWPIQLAAVLTLGWLVWTALGYASGWLRRLGPTRLLAGALPALLVVALTIAALPRASQGLGSIQAHREASREAGFYPSDPIYPWLRDEIRSPVVVLAPDIQGARIPAYSFEANVVSRRGGLVLGVLPELKKRAPGQIEVPQGSLDVREFFSGTTLQKGIEILRRNNVDYVMVAKDTQLADSLDRISGFEPVETPSERYDLYRVDLQRLTP